MYSFSQNFEDVYIYRAFREVTNGFYIDAGAFDPVVDSVTKMLYDLGWSGINLEPGPSFPTFSCRIRDLNLPYALTSTEGEVVFHYNALDPGTSTIAPSNIPAESSSVQSYKVISKTLEAVVREHAPDRHIHFLKLDIEGAEWDVLQSTDWRAVRPELIVTESCLPYTNIRRDAGWSDHMNYFGYHEVFFDGINTYYLREESLHRSDAFKFPVNVLDDVRKFDPQQHHILTESESSGLIKSISEEVARVVETESSAVRGFLESDLGPNLQAQKDLVAKLTLEQSEHFSRLRAIANDLSGSVYDADHGPSDIRRGNSIDAVLEEIAAGVSNLVEQRDQNAAELKRAQEVAVNARSALQEQEKLVDETRAQVRQLAKRLTVARDSRITMLELAERVAGALEEGDNTPENDDSALEGGDGAPDKLASGDGHQQRSFSQITPTIEPNSLLERIISARKVPAWRRLIRFGNRALVRRADTYRDSGRFVEAAATYARCYALRPDRIDLCLQMANMLTQLRTFELAEEAYREALAKVPDDGLILLHLGHMLELSDRPAEARDAYLESVKSIPDHPDVVQGLSRTAPSLNRDGEV